LVGSAIALNSGMGMALSHFPAYAQAGVAAGGYTARVSARVPASAPTSALLAIPTPEQQAEAAAIRAKKIARIEAAVLTIETHAGEYSTKDKIDILLQMAKAYSTLGEQARAVELLDNAVQLTQEDALERYPASPFRVVPTYIYMGETDAAESLLAHMIEAGDDIKISHLTDMAAAYIATRNSELADGKLSLAIDALGEPADWASGSSFIYYIGEIAKQYTQLPDSSLAQAGLSRLLVFINDGADAYGPDRFNKQFAIALSQLAIGHTHQGNTQAVPSLLAQALARIQDGEQTGYITADVARAYGYAEDNAVAQQALAEITALAVSNLSSGDPIGPVSALGAVAIAQKQLGNLSESEQALAIIADNFGESLYMLGGLLGIYSEMGDSSGQEAVIQQMFDKLPQLRNAQLVVSDVTASYAGISGLVEAYIQTTNDELAAERLALLESFFKEVEFDPLGRSGQLAMVATAAVRRRDYASAQRLLIEATQALAADGSLSEREYANAISRLTYGYHRLIDDGAKQAGLDALQQIANDNLSAEQNSRVTGIITRARVTL